MNNVHTDTVRPRPASNGVKLSEILTARGFVYQHTGDSIAEITDGEKRTLYLGIDPTADSIHIGHLAVCMMLRHFAADGHKIILLVGGGTGLIGDPKATEERPLMDEKEVRERAEKIRAQVMRLLGADVEIMNNAEWLVDLKLIEFLRDIGKHFTVNALVKKEIMAERLDNEVPLSYTEFAYPLLQAYDFMHLNQQRNCTVQVGASDQWTNITAGVELIHKKLGATAHAITTPLVIDKTTGKKFGKSEGNAVWLDPQKTSPFQFYQFWLNVDDVNVRDYLLRYTLLETDVIEQLMKEHEAAPEERKAQRALALEVTALVHGKPQADASVRVSEVLFGGVELAALSEVERDMLKASAPTCAAKVGDAAIDVLVSAGLASSKREARDFIESGGASINGKKVTDVTAVLADSDFVGGLALMRRGKRNVSVLVLA
ncbi:MAG: tyrosine--tRNA ligase [Parcubacteria group bacterium]|nr:tyrosine--tRNA ligase [Parcubacteria group bacterium]